VKLWLWWTVVELNWRWRGGGGVEVTVTGRGQSWSHGDGAGCSILSTAQISNGDMISSRLTINVAGSDKSPRKPKKFVLDEVQIILQTAV